MPASEERRRERRSIQCLEEMLGRSNDALYAATEMVRLLLDIHHERPFTLQNLLSYFFDVLRDLFSPLLNCIPMNPRRHGGIENQ